jgi:phosphinothricin acetyltransferase
VRVVRIRPAEPADLEPLLGIYNHYVAHSAATFEVAPVTPEDRREWFAEHRGGGPHRLLVAANESGGLSGFATTSTFRPRAAYATTVEASVYCRADVVGQGIGSRLYEALLASVQGEDLERIVAGVTLPNPASVALHHRFGFRPVGTFSRVGRKFGQFWDVEWFERPLRLP